MCNRYWDLYECRWQDYSRPEQSDMTTQLPDTLVPEPRAEPSPQEAQTLVSAPALSVG
ncbi:MAG: hypothetical protein ACLGIA_09360 [Actinomycetes bacterium]